MLRPRFLARAPRWATVEVPGHAGRSLTMGITAPRDQVLEALLVGWQQFECPLPDVFAAVVARAGGTVLDIGANTGFYSLLAAAVSTAVEVVAYEPNPPAIECFRANVAANPTADRIRLVTAAVSDRAGEASFFVPVADHGLIETSASLSADMKDTVGEVLTVPVTTVDQEAAGWLAPVTVLKIDVESLEHLVLEGAEATLARHRPVAFHELLPGIGRPDAIEAIRRAHRYTSVRLQPGVALVARSVAADRDTWNHALVPTEGLDGFLDTCRHVGLAVHYERSGLVCPPLPPGRAAPARVTPGSPLGLVLVPVPARSPARPIGPAGTTFPVDGPVSARAALVRLEAGEAPDPTFVSIGPGGDGLSLAPGGHCSRIVVATFDGDGLTVRTSTGTARASVEVLGWFVAGAEPGQLGYRPAPPARAFDSRLATGWRRGDDGPLVGHRVPLAASGPPPPGSVAVAANVTVTECQVFQRVSTPRPTLPGGVEVVSAPPGDTNAAMALLPLAGGGADLCLDHPGSQVVVDTYGWWAPGGALLRLLPRARVLDTRSGDALDAAATVTADLGGLLATAEGITVVAALLDVTATGATGATVVRVASDGAEPTPASLVNLGPGDTRANIVPLTLGPDALVRITNDAMPVHVVVDVVGVFTTID